MDQPSRKAMAGKLQIYGDGAKQELTMIERFPFVALVASL
jgi:hypothetical protein